LRAKHELSLLRAKRENKRKFEQERKSVLAVAYFQVEFETLGDKEPEEVILL
jgi:hypothetical protein